MAKTAERTHVWTFWEGEKPEIVRKCESSWKKHLPMSKYALHFLSPESSEVQAMTFPQNITMTQKSNLIRLRLLEEQGGVWMDASVYLTAPLDWVFKHNVFFFARPGKKYPESWFIYSKEKDPWFGSWRRTMEESLTSVGSHASRGAAQTGNDDCFVIYDCWCHLQKDWMFSDYTADWTIVDYRHVFYNPFIPLESHDRLVKFTKKGRQVYEHVAFPVPYLVLVAAIALIVGVVVVVATRQ